MAVRFVRFRNRRALVLAVVALIALVVLVAGVSHAFGRSARGGSSGASTSSTPSIAAPATGYADAAPESAGGGAAAPAAPSRDRSDPAQAVDPVTSDRALVRTAQLSVDVADAGVAVRQVRGAAAGASGLVVQEQTTDRGSTLVLRVPAAALDQVIDEVGGFGTVTWRRAQVSDATDQVVDLDARVASQQASVDRVRLLLARAESIGDIVSIESELAQREADLDSLKNRLAGLRDKVALSTLTIDLSGPGDVPPPIDQADGGFLGGLAAGWSGVLGLGAAVGAALGFLLPFLPVFAVLIGIGWLARRMVRGRRTVAPAGAGGGRGDPGSEADS